MLDYQGAEGIQNVFFNMFHRWDLPGKDITNASPLCVPRRLWFVRSSTKLRDYQWSIHLISFCTTSWILHTLLLLHSLCQTVRNIWCSLPFWAQKGQYAIVDIYIYLKPTSDKMAARTGLCLRSTPNVVRLLLASWRIEEWCTIPGWERSNAWSPSQIRIFQQPWKSLKERNFMYILEIQSLHSSTSILPFGVESLWFG